MSHPTASISRALLLLSVGTWACTAHLASAGMPDPWTTTFTYQGQLREAGQPATGLYDFEVCLYDSAVNPVSLTCIAPADDVPVEEGLFALDLDFGPDHFSGQPRYLELRVRQGDSAGGYTQLLPRQPLRPTPEAMHAAKVPWAGISGMPAGFADGIDDAGVTQITAGFGLIGGTITGTGTVAIDAAQVQRRVTGDCAVGSFVRSVAQDGSVTCGSHTTGWNLNGNAGTVAISSFLGTSDDRPLSLRANNQRVARYENVALTGPGGGSTANVVLGGPSNETSPGVRGGAIAGGGVSIGGDDPDFVSEGRNVVAGHYGFVGGGFNNVAGDWNSSDRVASAFAVVSGGRSNFAFGTLSMIGGGRDNRSSGSQSAVLGGALNVSSGSSSSVLGGVFNTASGSLSTTVGGLFLCAGAPYSLAAGRRAKVRPGLNSGSAGSGCNGIEVFGSDGDQGTFVWADSEDANFTSTGSNQFLIRAQGGVGIGTNAPQNQLHVRRSINANASVENHVVQFENPSTGTSPDVLALKVGTTNPGDGVNFISFLHGGATSLGSIEGNGSGGVVLAGPGNDFAEYLLKRDPDERIESGDVLGLRDGKLGRDTRGAQQIFVASSSPIIAGNDPGHSQRGRYVLAAMLGQVQLSVDGDAAPGDLLLPTGRGDGRARAVTVDAELDANERAQVFGQVLAREDRSEGITRVRALVGQGARELANAQALARIDAENARLREALAALRIEQARQLEEMRQVVLALQSEIRGKAVLAQRD